MVPNCTDRSKLEAEHVANVSSQECQTKRRCCQLYTSYHGLPSESLDGYTCEVEALVTGSKDDEKQLIGTRLVRRLGEVPGALAVEKVYIPDLAKSEKIKLVIVFLGNKRHKKDAPDKRLCANRQHKATSRRLGKTLQNFFATENAAYGDDVKTRVRIDPDKRAHHMLVRNGLTDDHINHTYGFVHDPKAATLDTRKTQEPALRFYDRLLDMDRHRDSSACLGRHSQPMLGPAAVDRSVSLAQTSDVASFSDQC